MKTNLKAILSSLVATACLSMGSVSTARADHSDLFVSVNAPGPGSTPGAVYQYTPTGTQSTFLPNVSKPRGLVFDSSGNMFLNTNAASGSPTTGTILRVAPDGTTTTFATGFTNDFFLEELAFDGAGNIFVNSSDLSPSATTITGTVFKVLPDGTVTTFGTVPGQAFGVAVDSAGNVFAASAGTDRTIYKFTPLGVRSVFAGPANFSGTQGPIGLMFDSSGNLFASTADSSGNGEILKFAPNGTKTVFATGLTNNPRGLAFDSNGNLFVAEVPSTATTGDILKFTPGGVKTTFASGIGRPEGNSGPEYLAFKSFCGCPGPQGPAGPQGPTGIGFESGGILMMKQGSTPPAGFTKLGTTDFQYKDSTGKNQKVTLDVYQKQ